MTVADIFKWTAVTLLTVGVAFLFRHLVIGFRGICDQQKDPNSSGLE